VPARHGWYWVRDGWRLVMRKPITWVAFSALTWLIISASSLHPLLMAAVAVLLPVILAGWALACREAEAGRPIPVTMLFEGFRGRVGDLASIGGLNLMGNMMLMLVVLAIGGEAFTEAITRPGALSPEAAGALQSRMSLALVVILAIGIPLAMAVWFAPLAVALDGLRGPGALAASLGGILRNGLPFVIYSAVLGGVGAVTFLALSATGMAPPVAMEAAFWMLMPLLVGSVYTSYRDIFGAAEQG